MTTRTWTIRSVLEWTDQHFKSKGIDSARLDAELLLAYVLECDRVSLYCHMDESLDEQHLGAYRELVAQRAQRKPLAYLIGRKEFMSINLWVTPDVLVPRPETETLVEAALAVLADHTCKVLDIGTGCGTIAVSIAFHHKGASVMGTDLSAEAVAVAQSNAEAFGVERRVRFVQGEWFEPVCEVDFDAVLCNPPYVAETDRDRVDPEARAWEPRLAVFCPTDPAQMYGALARGAVERLAPGGWLMLEVGYDSHELAEAEVQRTGAYEAVEVMRDLAGIERVVKARKRSNG